jgi:hypothetical protein
MKRIIRLMALLCALLPASAFAGPVCTCTAISTASTKVLAAYTGGPSGARRQMCLQNVSVTAADYAACNVGATSAVTISTGIILPAQSSTSAILVPPWCFPPAMYSSSTFPMVPNGEVDCIAAAGTPTICACSY